VEEMMMIVEVSIVWLAKMIVSVEKDIGAHRLLTVPIDVYQII
jgi:hypothetical protein